MNYLKIASPAWANYCGVIGTIEFKNGVSVYPVPRIFADKISAAMEMIEVDAEGNEIRPAGGAHRLITESRVRAPIAEKLTAVSQADLDAEERALAAKSDKPPVSRFYEAAELEAIASKGGIKALREVGDQWGVKGKAITALIIEILDAQATWFKERDARLERTIKREERETTPEMVDPSLGENIRIAGETDEEFDARVNPKEEPAAPAPDNNPAGAPADPAGEQTPDPEDDADGAENPTGQEGDAANEGDDAEVADEGDDVAEIEKSDG